MFVFTIDQVGSTHSADRVPELLAAVQDIDARLPFVRTVGDEVQGVLAEVESVLRVIEVTARQSGWSVGLGIGTVDEPLAASAPESRGPAFLAARQAVEDAKNSWAGLSVHTAQPHQWSADAQTVLRLLGRLVGSATVKQWAVISALLSRPDATQTQLARSLGVTQQLVSQVMRSGDGYAIAEVRATAARMLAYLDAGE